MKRQYRYEPTRSYRRYRCRVELSPGRGAGRWYALGMLLIVLTAALAFTYLRSERQKMVKQLQEMRGQFAVRAKEIANLSMEVESFRSGDYILTAVKRLDLGLRRPLPGQVRRISRTRAKGIRDDDSWRRQPMVASNGPGPAHDVHTELATEN